MVAILLGALALVYWTVNLSIDAQVSEDLNRLLNFDGEPKPELGPKPPNDAFRPKAERQIAFTLYFSPQGALLGGFAFFEPEAGFYESVVEALQLNRPQADFIEATKGVKRLFLDGNHWAYKGQANPSGDGTYKVVFLDITPQRAVLGGFVRNVALVSALMTVGIVAMAWWLMRRSVAPVEAAFERQRRFVSDASHELKTPIAVMAANLEALSTSDSQEDRSKWQDYMARALHHMKQLTESLLYLAQNEGHETLQALEKRPVNLQERLDHQLMQFEVLFFEAKLALDYVRAPEGNFTVAASLEQMDQVMAILLDNAIKYTPQGERVRVGLRTEGQWHLLTVANSGPGVAKEDLPYIFDRFYRSQSYRDQSGFGLGLAIAAAIVDHHGGTIACDREADMTLFIVRLPKYIQ